MDVQLEETGRFGRKLSVTVPAPQVQKAFDAVTKEIGKTTRVPGFRPGKAPRELLEKQFGGRIKGEVADKLVGETLMQALGEKNVAPLAMPQLQVGDLERGNAFSYSAEFEIPPEVKVTLTKGLKVPPLRVDVSADDIEKQLEQMRKQAAQLVPVLVRDVVEKGDVVLMDYEGTIGGVPFAGGKADNALIEVGGEGYLKEFSGGIEGAKCPSERSVPVTFPADYGNKDLAGKPATFKIKVKEIKKKEMPALDDEFARDMGSETLAALRTKVKEGLTLQKKRDAELDERKHLMEALVAANPFELPPSMVHEQAKRMVASATARIEQMVGRRFSLSLPERENLYKESLENAETQVRSGLLLLEIATQEKMEVDSAAIDAEIERMAASAGPEDGPRVRTYYRDRDQQERLRFKLLEDMVVKHLLEHAERDGTPLGGA